MKFKAIIFLISSATILNLHKTLSNVTKRELKCENEGCYEVIKTFAQLLEEKINETDKILAEAEKELNEVTHGNDDTFSDKINEINLKLSRLIIDLNTGIDGGEETLMELINNIFKSVYKTEAIATEIEIELTDGTRTMKIIDTEFGDIKDVIRKVQEEFRKLENTTSEDFPKAIQDAFDKSEKFHSDSKGIRDIHDNMKEILTDYESNLMNAKILTEDAIEKFAVIDESISESERIEKEIQQIFKVFEDVKLPFDTLANMNSISQKASYEVNLVFDDAFNLLNEVTIFNVDGKLDEIEKNMNELENFVAYGDKKLKQFVDESSKFLDELEANLDAAAVLEKKTWVQREKLEELLKDMKDLKDSSEDSLKKVEVTVKTARTILDTLEGFSLKVEESREMALRAFEQIPEILKKIQDAEAIVEELEERVERNEVIGNEAKEKSIKVRDDMIKILKDSEIIKIESDKLTDNADKIYDEIKAVGKEESHLSDEIEKLKIIARDTENLIDIGQAKSERSKLQAEQLAPKIDDGIKNLQDLIAEIEAAKMIDENVLDELERKVIEAENEMEKTQIKLKINNLKEKREEQNQLIEEYKVEIASLEHEVAIIRENAKSLTEDCVKRTKLEP